jgi:predicted dehydrogenase
MSAKRAIVVGAGGVARAWFRTLPREDVQIVAVVEINPDVAQEHMAQFGIEAEVSTDLAAMLKKHKPDFVVDLTIPQAHADVTCMALKAGCPVIGEKPMADTLEHAQLMVKTAEETGLVYSVAQTQRWEHVNDRMREAVLTGELGPLTAVNCNYYNAEHAGGFRQAMESPLLLDMAIHHFDLARFITGLDPVSVYCHEYHPQGTTYEGRPSASCIFEMEQGVIFTYSGSRAAEGCRTTYRGDWRIIGTRGSCVLETGKFGWPPRAAHSDHPAHPAWPQPRMQVITGDEGYFRPMEDVEPPASVVTLERQHGALREFLDALAGGPVPQTECHDNVKSLAMATCAVESARLGKKVPVVW